MVVPNPTLPSHQIFIDPESNYCNLSQLKAQTHLKNLKSIPLDNHRDPLE